MAHPFGDLLNQFLHRKHSLSQAKLADGILQPPQIISLMCKGERLNGQQARERVVAMIAWLHEQAVLATRDEANALLVAAGMGKLHPARPAEARLLETLSAVRAEVVPTPVPAMRRTNLPLPLTSFIGRDRDLANLTRLMEPARLVTLTGTGGAGQTRLAIELARHHTGSYTHGI